ncbi:hypothetical protein [Streptomyces sp.]|uniref:hypothetical protein n=1 Tax=Streptomyces sp. TaxID=1931 RepID=UPI002F932069
MSTPERETRAAAHRGGGVVTMRDLLASCAAADAVSTPDVVRDAEREREDVTEQPELRQDAA